MKVLIVEDEKLAFERLCLLLERLDFESQAILHCSSISQAVKLIDENLFDLAFFDIELEDGLSFEILEKAKISFPIIFTTAYNQHAIKAFKHNSIDYLLKPVDPKELAGAIDKYNTYWKNIPVESNQNILVEELRSMMNNSFKERFIVKIGEHIRIVETKSIKLIFSQNKGTYFRTTKDILVDYSLDKLEELISPKLFFRISRKHIVALESIKDIIAYSNSRLKIILDTDFDEDLIVSREKVKDFKAWLEA